MIKVNKAAEPSVLSTNKVQWTNDLLNRINAVGGYNDLSKRDREQFVYHYKHTDVHTALKNGMQVERCIYCESNITTGDPNVEHYHPKSLYPGETFEWNNLFSACTSCNRSKGSFDTVSNPFIHPAAEDPEEFLSYQMLEIKPRYLQSTDAAKYKKGKNVIDNCNLKRVELIYPLSDTMKNTSICAHPLRSQIEKYRESVQNPKKLEAARQILSTLNCLFRLARPTEEYAGFVRECLRQNRYVREAVDIVNVHASELGIGASFSWGWNFNLPPEI